MWAMAEKQQIAISEISIAIWKPEWRPVWHLDCSHLSISVVTYFPCSIIMSDKTLTTWSNAAPPPSFKGSSLGAWDNFDNLDCKGNKKWYRIKCSKEKSSCISFQTAFF